ncbi:hypothetical protein BDY19DRAFT_940918 [Irpex rosettiformis]|uniref:Uncharacterized protein n=1 Tax=Irpex rosettiformis TaxID=378272 RepID=A0ACB8U636_9APHY|nr:hypothetical protein BDY19DRAFT_940918 [Irpex rosettiformis]
MSYGENAAVNAAEEMELEEEEEESRELTHDEMWDDSALIEAWNSATAEYEAYHGKNKEWKNETVKKSPLWYNVPPEKKTGGKAHASVSPGIDNNGVEENSAPFDFDTYTPTHDPSLPAATMAATAAGPGPDFSQFTLSHPSGSSVSPDEAFQKALSATYWAGYWTAVYHCQSKERGQQPEEEQADHPDDEEDIEDNSADLLTTQR